LILYSFFPAQNIILVSILVSPPPLAGYSSSGTMSVPPQTTDKYTVSREAKQWGIIPIQVRVSPSKIGGIPRIKTQGKPQRFVQSLN
jgi:hypothetical protein